MTPLETLHAKHDGAPPQGELDRAMGRDAAVLRRARATVAHYTRELDEAQKALALWNAACEAGDTLDFEEEYFETLEERYSGRVKDAQRILLTWHQHLGRVTFGLRPKVTP